MWSRTFAGFLLGLLLSISVVLNLNLLLPIKEATMLLIGLLCAFPIWASCQVWAYTFTSSKKAWQTLTLTLAPSALLNALLLTLRYYS
ncbi:MAG: hypothetical protein HRU24_04890 [Gammaproteobacteria bacterium]|nr:hypothetical protein [Gammaproteobacteria bacterium]